MLEPGSFWFDDLHRSLLAGVLVQDQPPPPFGGVGDDHMEAVLKSQ